MAQPPQNVDAGVVQNILEEHIQAAPPAGPAAAPAANQQDALVDAVSFCTFLPRVILLHSQLVVWTSGPR